MKKNDTYYWKGRNEVDFVIKEPELIAINVTNNNEISDREIKGLIEFKKEFPKTKNLILLTEDIEKEEDNIRFIPIWKYLLEIS